MYNLVPKKHPGTIPTYLQLEKAILSQTVITIFILIIINKSKRLLREIMYVVVPKKHVIQKLVAKPDQSTGGCPTVD